jgi:hypothetical protein
MLTILVRAENPLRAGAARPREANAANGVGKEREQAPAQGKKALGQATVAVPVLDLSVEVALKAQLLVLD